MCRLRLRSMVLALHWPLVDQAEGLFWRHCCFEGRFQKLFVQLSVSATGLGFEFNYDNLKITSQVVLED